MLLSLTYITKTYGKLQIYETLMEKEETTGGSWESIKIKFYG